MSIIPGTTPTLTLSLERSITACGTVRILRPLSELSLSADGTEVSLRLTQTETLMLPDNQIAKVQLRVMLGGAVFATDSIPVPTKELLHREELIADAN